MDPAFSRYHQPYTPSGDPKKVRKLLLGYLPVRGKDLTNIIFRKFGPRVIFADRCCAVCNFISEVLLSRSPTKMFRVNAAAVAAIVRDFVLSSRFAAVHRLA